MKLKKDAFLIYQLALKELKVKYKNAYLGFLWTIIVPVVMMFVFMVVFKYILRMPVTPEFLLLGLFPWTYTTLCLTASTTVFVDNMSILKKIYFPRYYLVLAVVLSNLVGFFISMLLMFFLNITFSTALFFVWLPFLMQFLFTVGICLIFGSLFVYFRDIKYFVEILLVAWFYITPVFYAQSEVLKISKRALYVYLLNPMSGIIVMYRDFILYGTVTSFELMAITFIECVIVFLTGIFIYRKLQGNFIDYA